MAQLRTWDERHSKDKVKRQHFASIAQPHRHARTERLRCPLPYELLDADRCGIEDHLVAPWHLHDSLQDQRQARSISRQAQTGEIGVLRWARLSESRNELLQQEGAAEDEVLLVWRTRQPGQKAILEVEIAHDLRSIGSNAQAPPDVIQTSLDANRLRRVEIVGHVYPPFA